MIQTTPAAPATQSTSLAIAAPISQEQSTVGKLGWVPLATILTQLH